MKFCLKVNSLSDLPTRGYSPDVIKTAYNISDKGDGRGVSVAIFDFIGNENVQTNLDVFSEKYDLPSTEIIRHDDVNTSADFNYSAYIEPCADTQWVHAISPKAELHLYKVSNYDAVGAMESVKRSVEHGCDIILLTFQTQFDAEYLKYTSIFESNTVFIASAGDYGSGAFFPSCYAGCISVGGTSVPLSKDGRRLGEEIVWSGSGGGICNYIDIPLYQRRFDEINSLTDGMRGVPDVSFLADPDYGYSVYHSSINGTYGWYSMGGTSLSASVIAGIVSNYLSYSGREDKKGIISHLYKLAGETEYTNPSNRFIDIVKGNNGSFEAKIGYDLCTGLGSFIGF